MPTGDRAAGDRAGHRVRGQPDRSLLRRAASARLSRPPSREGGRRAMQVGVTVQNLGGFPEPDSGVQGCLQVAEHADRLGFDSVWVVDHVVLPAAVASRYPYNTSGVPGFDWRMD